jgi:hypothetical protein
MQESIFYFWILGIPIIIITFFTRRNYGILLVNTFNLISVDESIKHLVYLSSMLLWYKTDKAIQLTLNGYFEYHKFICLNKDCISKKDNYYTNKSAKLL